MNNIVTMFLLLFYFLSTIKMVQIIVFFVLHKLILEIYQLDINNNPISTFTCVEPQKHNNRCNFTLIGSFVRHFSKFVDFLLACFTHITKHTHTSHTSISRARPSIDSSIFHMWTHMGVICYMEAVRYLEPASKTNKCLSAA